MHRFGGGDGDPGTGGDIAASGYSCESGDKYAEVWGSNVRLFDVTIDVDNVTNFHSWQFNLSFDPAVVNVTGVALGSLDREAMPEPDWAFVDEGRIRVILEISGTAGQYRS